MKAMKCRICNKTLDKAHFGMCEDCLFLYEVILKTNSSSVKKESLEKILKKSKKDYKNWEEKFKDEFWNEKKS